VTHIHLVGEDKTTYWKFIEQINFDNNFYSTHSPSTFPFIQ